MSKPNFHFVDEARGRCNVRTVWTLCGKAARSSQVLGRGDKYRRKVAREQNRMCGACEIAYAEAATGTADDLVSAATVGAIRRVLRGSGGTLDWDELSELRRRWLELEGVDAEEIHGWLIGVSIAIERKRKANPAASDALIAELRASTPPDDKRGL